MQFHVVFCYTIAYTVSLVTVLCFAALRILVIYISIAKLAVSFSDNWTLRGQELFSRGKKIPLLVCAIFQFIPAAHVYLRYLESVRVPEFSACYIWKGTGGLAKTLKMEKRKAKTRQRYRRIQEREENTRCPVDHKL